MPRSPSRAVMFCCCSCSRRAESSRSMTRWPLRHQGAVVDHPLDGTGERAAGAGLHLAHHLAVVGRLQGAPLDHRHRQEFVLHGVGEQVRSLRLEQSERRQEGEPRRPAITSGERATAATSHHSPLAAGRRLAHRGGGGMTVPLGPRSAAGRSMGGNGSGRPTVSAGRDGSECSWSCGIGVGEAEDRGSVDWRSGRQGWISGREGVRGRWREDRG